jgi:hypothetical protein
MQAGHAGQQFGVYDFNLALGETSLGKQRIQDGQHHVRSVEEVLRSTRGKKGLHALVNSWKSNKTIVDELLSIEPCSLREGSSLAQFDKDYHHQLEIDDDFFSKVMTTVLRGINEDPKVMAKLEKPVDMYFSAIDLTMRGGVKGKSQYTYGEIVEAIAGEGFFTWMEGEKFRFRHGFPIVSFYLTGYEISTLMSALVGASRDMIEATPTFSRNVSFKVRSRGWFSGRMMVAGEIKDVKIDGEPIQSKKLYQVATSIFLAEAIFYEWSRRTSISMIGGLVKSLVGLEPKDARGHKYDLSNPRTLHDLALIQYLPTEYQAFAERFAEQCGKMDEK